MVAKYFHNFCSIKALIQCYFAKKKGCKNLTVTGWSDFEMCVDPLSFCTLDLLNLIHIFFQLHYLLTETMEMSTKDLQKLCARFPNQVCKCQCLYISHSRFIYIF